MNIWDNFDCEPWNLMWCLYQYSIQQPGKSQGNSDQAEARVKQQILQGLVMLDTDPHNFMCLIRISRKRCLCHGYNPYWLW